MGYLLYYNKKREYLRDIIKLSTKPKSLRFITQKEDALIFFDRSQIVELIHEMVSPKTHMHWEIHPYGLAIDDNQFVLNGNTYLFAESNKNLFPGDQLMRISGENAGTEIVTVHFDQTIVTRNKGDIYFERVRAIRGNEEEPVIAIRNHYRKFTTINGLSLLDFYGYGFRDEIKAGGKTYLVKFMYSVGKICATDMDDKYSYRTFSREEIIKNK